MDSLRPVVPAAPCEEPGRRRVRPGAIVLALLLTGAGHAAAATLDVVVQGVEPDGGRVFVSLCVDGLEPQDCPAGAMAAPTGETVSVSFPQVAPGTYAVAVFQDANGNGVLDRTRNGLPLEPYGFSNAAGRQSVPRFERAAFSLRGDAAVTVRLSAMARRRSGQP